MSALFVRRTRLADLLIAGGLVGLATATFLPFRPFLGSEQWGWPYLLVVGLTAGLLGVWPALLAAVLAFLLWNFLFIDPYYTLHVNASSDLSHLLTFLVVAAIVGLQTGRLKEASREKDAQTARTAALYRLSSAIALGASLEDVIDAADREVRAVLEVSTVRIGETDPDQVDRAEYGSRTTLIELQSASGTEGVLELIAGSTPSAPDLAFIKSVAHLIAVATENRRMNELSIATSASQEAERLRSALVSSVSHELKTPVASLTARVTDLMTRVDAPDEEDLSDALQAMKDDLDRLNRSIGNLLEASRLEARAWTPSPTQFEPGELIGAVARQFSRQQRERLGFKVEASVPSVLADFAQVSRALTHIVDNALLYSQGVVLIGAEQQGHDGRIMVWVEDDGPGLRDDERDKVFDRFYRGSAGRLSSSSTGLGLSLAKEFIVANGGDVWTENLQRGGFRLTMSLPAEQRTTASDEGCDIWVSRRD